MHSQSRWRLCWRNRNVPTRSSSSTTILPDGTADRLATAEPGVDIICMPENLGPGAAIAAGMRRAFSDGADIVWLVEDDTLYGADYLRAGVRCLVEQPTIAMLGSHGWDFDGFLWHGHPIATDEIAHGVLPALDGALVRRNDALAVGFPAENFFLMMDDVEYPLRMYEHQRIVAVWSQLQSRPLRLGASSEPGGPTVSVVLPDPKSLENGPRPRFRSDDVGLSPSNSGARRHRRPKAGGLPHDGRCVRSESSTRPRQDGPHDRAGTTVAGQEIDGPFLV